MTASAPSRLRRSSTNGVAQGDVLAARARLGREVGGVPAHRQREDEAADAGECEGPPPRPAGGEERRR